VPQSDRFGAFFPTSHSHPLGDDDPVCDRLVLAFLQATIEPNPTLLMSPGGLLCLGAPREQRLVQDTLEDPRFVRQLRTLYAGSVARQHAAWTAVLRDPNPRVALLALLGEPIREPDPFTSIGLQWLGPGPWAWGPYVWGSPGIILPEPAAADVAAALRRVLEGPPLPDHVQADLLRFGLVHSEAAVRDAARPLFLERLTEDVLQGLVNVRPIGIGWPPAEREQTLDALTQRLRRELNAGDTTNAEVLGEMLFVCDQGLLPATSAVRSGVLELAADLLREDLTRGNTLEVLHPDGAVLAAQELLRSSDPDVRRAAWLLMLRVSADTGSRMPKSNDPYLESVELLESE
jgi:hypothetical protein